MQNISIIAITCCLLLVACKKSTPNNPAPPPTPTSLQVRSLLFNRAPLAVNNFNAPIQPTITITFNAPLNPTTVPTSISCSPASGGIITLNHTLSRGDSVLTIQPTSPLSYLTRYVFQLSTDIKSSAGGSLSIPESFAFTTRIDSTRKFPIITDDSLLTLTQQQTFKYFWDFAHPVSGMIRERNTSGDLVTTGGTGFGVMAIVTGIHRGFITRAQGLARMQTMVGFLKNTAQKFKGAFPHWLNGISGVVIPFSAKDNGADLVETSLLMQGLLTARQYFSGSDPAETQLRTDINQIWNNIEWSWFRKNNEQLLYWHWSPNFGWDINLPIRGWNECLITYVLAASSTTHGIPASVYQQGWKNSTTYTNGNTYYGFALPLGAARGGPLFYAHYSFLGINPTGLQEGGIDFWTQNLRHSLINEAHCRTNPNGWFGYSENCWGLTASDIPGGYSASSPTNDLGVIAPTAAISSMPYTPTESKRALRFFYDVLGDKLWKQYGFIDAFSLHQPWFADSFLAIDQGPIIVMIENHRSGLLWNLFTSCPEVKSGMRNLGFTAPYL